MPARKPPAVAAKPPAKKVTKPVPAKAIAAKVATAKKPAAVKAPIKKAVAEKPPAPTAKEAKRAAVKIPKALGSAADLYFSTRESRLKLDRQAASIKTEEGVLRDHLIENIPKSHATGIAGKLCRVSITTEDIPVVTDWPKFYAYIAKNHKTGAFALLNRALNTAAVNELWNAGKKIPGVGTFKTSKISMNKL